MPNTTQSPTQRLQLANSSVSSSSRPQGVKDRESLDTGQLCLHRLVSRHQLCLRHNKTCYAGQRGHRLTAGCLAGVVASPPAPSLLHDANSILFQEKVKGDAELYQICSPTLQQRPLSQNQLSSL
ncbi:uncharacterized protein LOC116007990 [Ipomoea triloba]|uniref:uncharacterized protein LOC116007990 n=1 Tax=Ipomoea triloba TaxID=35885 RepID=UPI00125CECF8|nr:uncharacterized protein LOC116007990 [Ipomoea triloba]